MQIPRQVQSTWKQWLDGAHIQSIRGGLSSSKVWRVQPAQGHPCCLKAWPDDAIDSARLSDLHRFMAALNARLSFTPRILAPAISSTPCFVQHSGYYWELSTWLAGRPLRPDEAHLAHGESAVRAIIQLHLTSRSWFTAVGSSPSVATRLESLGEYYRRLSNLRRTVSVVPVPINRLSQQTLLHFENSAIALIEKLEHLRNSVELLWVVRDLHREHMLFEETEVTGVIDFGAARLDEPIIDLVRLLGSLWPLNRDMRYHLLDCYSNLSGQADLQVRLPTLDHASTLLSAMQWMQWLAIEQRSFATEHPRLLERWQQLNQRLDYNQW